MKKKEVMASDNEALQIFYTKSCQPGLSQRHQQMKSTDWKKNYF